MSGLLFSKPLYRGTLLKRYKRFLADVQLDTGEILTIHCPNTGAMTDLAQEGTIVWFSGQDHDLLYCQESSPDILTLLQGTKEVTEGSLRDYCSGWIEKDVKLKKVVTKRRYPHTWQMIQQGDLFIGVNTQNPNRLIRLGLFCQDLPNFPTYEHIAPEFAVDRHRLDFFCENSPHDALHMEVKNVHWRQKNLEKAEYGLEKFPWAYFPDTVTERARNHVALLEKMGSQGHKTALMYVVQREDCLGVQASKEADFLYWSTLQDCRYLKIYGYNCVLSPLGIALKDPLIVQ